MSDLTEVPVPDYRTITIDGRVAALEELVRQLTKRIEELETRNDINSPPPR